MNATPPHAPARPFPKLRPLARGAALIGLLVVPLALASHTSNLERRVRFYENRGYYQTHGPSYGDLYDGGSTRWTVYLRGGMEYKVFGACDDDCRDLDLAIRDEFNRLVDSDTEDDDIPLMTVRPVSSGLYTITASMADCRVNPCAYGVGVHGR